MIVGSQKQRRFPLFRTLFWLFSILFAFLPASYQTALAAEAASDPVISGHWYYIFPVDRQRRAMTYEAFGKWDYIKLAPSEDSTYRNATPILVQRTSSGDYFLRSRSSHHGNGLTYFYAGNSGIYLTTAQQATRWFFRSAGHRLGHFIMSRYSAFRLEFYLIHDHWKTLPSAENKHDKLWLSTYTGPGTNYPTSWRFVEAHL